MEPRRGRRGPSEALRLPLHHLWSLGSQKQHRAKKPGISGLLLGQAVRTATNIQPAKCGKVPASAAMISSQTSRAWHDACSDVLECWAVGWVLPVFLRHSLSLETVCCSFFLLRCKAFDPSDRECCPRTKSLQAWSQQLLMMAASSLDKQVSGKWRHGAHRVAVQRVTSRQGTGRKGRTFRCFVMAWLQALPVSSIWMNFSGRCPLLTYLGNQTLLTLPTSATPTPMELHSRYWALASELIITRTETSK